MTKLFNEFFESEKAGGIVLIFATLVSLVLANSGWQDSYNGFWQQDLGDHTLVQWINDGLMSIFFLLIGLELERELYKGELSSLKNASFSIFAALGGMLVPAGIFLLFNFGTPTQDGVGIPMATDIAFALGILSLLGSRVPLSLKVFLTALAIIDDLGAITVIAIFYTDSLSFPDLFIALGLFGTMLVLNRLRVHNLIPYLIGGAVMWYFMLHSGIHATIAGVLLALAIPFGSGGEKSPSYILQHFLHKPVAFVVLPIFAIANTGIVLDKGWHLGFIDPNAIGIMAGLVIGKPLGILLFAGLGVALGLCSLPTKIKWKHIAGVGMLAGVGFTMAIFIALLAFDDLDKVNVSKIAILAASILAGIIGFFWLKRILGKAEESVESPLD